MKNKFFEKKNGKSKENSHSCMLFFSNFPVLLIVQGHTRQIQFQLVKKSKKGRLPGRSATISS